MPDNPLAAWIELTFGLEQEPDGHLRRRIPISLEMGAKKLADITSLDVETCQRRLQQIFLTGGQLKLPDGDPVFAFKLHQFISQRRTVYATLEPISKRFCSLEGQYYAPGDKNERILYPLLFCRVCGQDYYAVLKDDANERLLPYNLESKALVEEGYQGGYVMIPPENGEATWSPEHLPVEWMDPKGKVKRDYRSCEPKLLWVLPDGTFTEASREGSAKGWFQPEPFMLCLNCGEFYTRREKEFSKLASLSSEGRSSTTTVLSVSALQHAFLGGIKETARKILSFTDNRQGASLQAGHFNDFVKVSLLRGAILDALEQHQQLRFDTVAEKVVSSMNLTLQDVSANPELQSDTQQGQEVWATFRDLIEYRIYEDLRRG